MRGAVAEAVEVMAAIRREGDVWSFAYDGEVVRLRDSKGVGYVLRLLRHPGVRFHASDLAAAREPADSGPGPDASGADAERARLNVGRAIALVLRKIASAHPPLGRHLETTIETGLFCCYTPDPRAPVRWIA
jgi:hypothetical protein